MSKVVHLSPETTQFEANGITYTYEEGLSLERYRWFERFRLEAGFGVSVGELVNLVKQNVDYLERFAQGEKVYSEMATHNHNALKGIADLAGKEPYSYWLCTLFFNTADEDRRYYKEDLMREKIQNWTEAGITADFFIIKACGTIKGFSRIYEEITQMSLAWQIPNETDPPSDENSQ